MKNAFVKSCLFLVMLVSAAAAQRKLTAPTYYIVISAQRSEPDGVHFNGASNLPPGSEIAVQVTEFYQGAWKDYSHRVCVAINAEGFFSGDLRPEGTMRFRNNLVLRADFGTRLCDQPAETLRVLGKHGERLANVEDPRIPLEQLDGVSHNPQLFRWSGSYYGLEVIARLLTGGSWSTQPENPK